MRVLLLLIFSAAILGLLAEPGLSQSIYVWDKDHDKTFPDPEGSFPVDATYGISKALNNLGYAFDYGTAVPDFSNYDIVFVIMGVYC